jgi:anti-sigma regulatory factor (Ser/Thr protein kinase)
LIRLVGWLTTDSTAPAQARRFVALPCAQLPTTALHEVLLLTTELVSNAVIHGAGPPRLDVRLDGGRVTVGVTDQGDGAPELAAGFDWPNGRNGLQLVQTLSEQWGVERSPERPGKRVWFEHVHTPAAFREEQLTSTLLGA